MILTQELDEAQRTIAALQQQLADMRTRAVIESERLRGLLRQWTDMDPLRYDSEYPCPWCSFDYSSMRHESDCAFVLARAECGIAEGAVAQ